MKIVIEGLNLSDVIFIEILDIFKEKIGTFSFNMLLFYLILLLNY